jgi:PhoH-like ATPase
MREKVYVLDTNVLIHDPESIHKFEENMVVIPFKVIEELDHLKKGTGEIAYSARQVLREIDKIRDRGDISKGVELPESGILMIAPDLGAASADDQVVESALRLKENGNGHCHVAVVSKDTTVRIKASYKGLSNEDYRSDKTTIFQKYGNVQNGDYRNGIKSVRYLMDGDSLSRVTGSFDRKEVKRGKGAGGIFPKNAEQECAVDALLNPDIEIVALTGPAGTGKTLLAIAAGIHQTTKKYPLYEQVLVSRPIIPMGNDIGYLPGTMDNKLAPWMQPIFDNLEVIVHTPKEKKDDADVSAYKSYQYLIDKGILHVEALTYIRGRSLPKRYFIVDEAQNLRPIDVKTLVTRCGAGTKIVLTGDILQIDNPFMDSLSNGLSYLISRFINEENFCYLNLRESVRSKLAEQGSRLL